MSRLLDLPLVPAHGNRTSADEIIVGRDMPVTLGIAINGKLVNPIAGTVMSNLPNIIPDDSVVYVI